jgi:hypothetical protein
MPFASPLGLQILEQEFRGQCLVLARHSPAASGDPPLIRPVLNLNLILGAPGYMLSRRFPETALYEGVTGVQLVGGFGIAVGDHADALTGEKRNKGCAAGVSAVCLRKQLQNYSARLLAMGRTR